MRKLIFIFGTMFIFMTACQPKVNSTVDTIEVIDSIAIDSITVDSVVTDSVN